MRRDGGESHWARVGARVAARSRRDRLGRVSVVDHKVERRQRRRRAARRVGEDRRDELRGEIAPRSREPAVDGERGKGAREGAGGAAALAHQRYQKYDGSRMK